MKHLPLCLLLIATSCMTLGETRELRASYAELRSRIEGGVATVGDLEEFDDRLAAAESKARRRTPDTLPTDPLSMALYLAGVAGSVLGSAKVVNMQRDKARKLRGEAVELPSKGFLRWQSEGAEAARAEPVAAPKGEVAT